MSIGKALEATVLYDAPDGRTVYRPWGARGPCYLVAPQARRRFVIYLRAWYGLLLVAIVVMPFAFGSNSIYIAITAWLFGSYGLMALLARGLPRTEPPPKPTPQQVQQALARIGFGRRTLLVLLALCLFMFIMSGVVLVAGFAWQGILGLVVFGLFSLVYIRQLRSRAA
jgi:hypothetical protein